MQIKNKGFTLIETLFYIAGLIIFLSVISTVLIYMNDWYRNATIPSRVDQAGIIILDKITKDIHGSGTINDAYSSFNTDNGILSLTAVNNSVQIIKKFSLLNGCVSYQIDSGTATCISPNGMTVTRLSFTEATSTISTAIKFDIDIEYRIKQATTTKTFSSFAILKQSYE